MQLDLTSDPDTPATAIRLGLRTGRHALREHLKKMGDLGVAHVSFNLRPGDRPVEDVLRELAARILPDFPSAASPAGPGPGGPRTLRPGPAQPVGRLDQAGCFTQVPTT
ncbi:hypothetical protein AB0K02_29800 [Streptomyces sp. NPDC049597]|uniref:hypothetical protein n=1 Tax=Streptomyces sp. NPDC049597 TaxID=3155276 RepID=UPI003439FC6F